MKRDWLGIWLIAVSLASLLFIVPHVVEDFAEEITRRAGLSTASASFLLGGYLALQSLGLVLIALGKRSGFVLSFWIGLIWVAGAVLDHGPAVLRGGFRSGALSVLWVVGLVLTQSLSAALAAWEAWGRRGRVGLPFAG
ncbi:MAG: hypothetical protein HY215_04160 [Candidatus Rokubacteria bacterium]|nr:hypothetical protein [Candidatus Rokubacteria bacterium]